jgi:hypothetical protein
MIPDFFNWCRSLLGSPPSSDVTNPVQAPSVFDLPLEQRAGDLNRWRDEQIARIGALTDVASLIEAMDDHNGYFRHAALARCAVWLHADLLPALLLRLNDWVPQVREQAQATLAQYLAQYDRAIASKLITLLPQVAALGQRQRADHKASQLAIEQYLQQAVCWPLLQNALLENELPCARHCFRLLYAMQTMPLANLAQHALGRKDVLLTAMVLDCCMELDSAARARLHQQLLSSPFNTARAIALREILQDALQQPDSAQMALKPILGKAIFDRSALVRDVVWHWHVRQGIDPHTPWRAIWSLPNPGAQQLRCAIWAALKVDARDLLPELRQLCHASTPSVRSVARLACAQFAPEMLPELMQQALLDSAPAAKQQVQILTRRYKTPIPLATLSDLCQHENGANRVLALLDLVEKWDALIFIFAIGRQHGQGMQTLLENKLHQWVQNDHKQYHGPHAVQRQQLLSLLMPDLPTFLLVEQGESMNDWRVRLRFILKCNQVLQYTPK